MLGKGLPNAGIVYRDVVVMGLKREKQGKNENLRLWGIQGRRDYLDVLYENVLYSQLDESSTGLRVTLVEELTYEEFFELRHNMGRNRMLREIPKDFSEFLDAVLQEEYRLYAHYTLKERERGPTPETEERLILARGVQVQGPEERLARKEAENREYKFYAFVSHAERNKDGNKDERWARYLQLRLENFRISVDSVSKLRREEYVIQPDFSEPIPKRLRVARGGAEPDSGTVSPSNLARYLIVVCSPHGAKTERVERDTKDFVDSGKEDYIIPFIVDGEPVGPEATRCYPPSLMANILGVSLSDGTREEAFIRVMARLLRVKFSRLYQRHLRERRRFLARALMAASMVLAVLSGLTVWAVSREIEASRRQEEADEVARFLVQEIRDDPRLPEGVRVMIGERIQQYQKKRNG